MTAMSSDDRDLKTVDDLAKSILAYGSFVSLDKAFGQSYLKWSERLKRLSELLFKWVLTLLE